MRTQSRTAPPRRLHTGCPYAFPVMSHRACSMPLAALDSTTPFRHQKRRRICCHRSLILVGSCPTSSGPKWCSIMAATACSWYSVVASPTPVKPLSVSMRTKIQLRDGACPPGPGTPMMWAVTLLIFIWFYVPAKFCAGPLTIVQTYITMWNMFSSRICVSVCLAALLSASKAPAAASKRYAVVVGRTADPLELYAASELRKYLRSLYGLDVPLENSPSPDCDGYLIVGNPKSNPETSVALNRPWPKISDQGIVLKRV